MPKRLKAGSELAAYRAKMHEQQCGHDPIAGKPITDPVLDHDHDTGRCRSCLDRRTNAWEGKVKNSFKRCGLARWGVDYPAALRALADYIEKNYSRRPLHPTHRTDEEKRLRRNKRARAARKK